MESNLIIRQGANDGWFIIKDGQPILGSNNKKLIYFLFKYVVLYYKVSKNTLLNGAFRCINCKNFNQVDGIYNCRLHKAKVNIKNPYDEYCKDFEN